MSRKSSQSEPARPELRMPPAEAASKISERVIKADEIRSRDIHSTPQFEQARDEYQRWDSYNIELLRQIFTSDDLADEYVGWGGSVSRPRSPEEQWRALQRDITEKINRLNSISERLELIPLATGVAKSVVANARARTNKAFVVHGHDEAARESVARFLERLGVEAVILHEQATEGRTIVEKLEHYAEVDFAVVLLTPDDVGAVKSAPDRLQARARQNVVLELGFFVGKLSRKHVCALYKGPLELPSDYLGVGYVALDESGGWRLQLAKELRSAGFAIDMNQAL